MRDTTATWSHQAPANSQYNAMIRDEEKFHAEQQMENASHVRWGTAFIAANVLNPVQHGEPYVAATNAQSLALAQQAFTASRTAEDQRSFNYLNQQNVICDDEREAKGAVNASHRADMPCTYPNCP